MNTIAKTTILCLTLLLVSIGFTQPLFAQTQSIESSKKVIAALKANNIDQFVGFFNDPIDITLGDNIDDSYSKTQGGMITKKFLKSNPLTSFEVKQTGSANDGSTFIIGLYKSQDGTVFRIYLLIKKLNGKYSIHLFEMEEE